MRKTAWVLSLMLFLCVGIQLADAGVGQIAANKIWSVNIIAYENCPKTENAQRIAVQADYVRNNITGLTLVDIDKTNKIFLVPGPDFRVLDSLACDRGGEVDGALLQLEGQAGVSVSYEVWVRLVGPPDSSIDVLTCGTDPLAGNVIVCNTEAFVKVRETGKGEPSFTNATSKLLFLNGVKLFDARYENYFWDWGTTGKPHAQVWFIQPE